MPEPITPTVLHKKDWLVNGKIPKGTVCPFRVICEAAKNGSCYHRGPEHTVEYSCGSARWYNLNNTFQTMTKENPHA